MGVKPFRTTPKSASAERCFRALGATMDMSHPITSPLNHSRQGVFSHRCLRKASAADPVITRLGGSAGIAGLKRLPRDVACMMGREHHLPVLLGDGPHGLAPVAPLPHAQTAKHEGAGIARIMEEMQHTGMTEIAPHQIAPLGAMVETAGKAQSLVPKP